MHRLELDRNHLICAVAIFGSSGRSDSWLIHLPAENWLIRRRRSGRIVRFRYLVDGPQRAESIGCFDIELGIVLIPSG